MKPRPKMAKFVLTTCAACFARQNPVSTRAKPACMKMTRMAPMTTHSRLTCPPSAATGSSCIGMRPVESDSIHSSCVCSAGRIAMPGGNLHTSHFAGISPLFRVDFLFVAAASTPRHQRVRDPRSGARSPFSKMMQLSRSARVVQHISGEASGEDEEFGQFDRGGRERVGARLDAGERIDPEVVGVQHQAQFAWRVAAGPEVDGGDLARFGTDVGPLVRHAGRRVERRCPRGTGRRSRR